MQGASAPQGVGQPSVRPALERVSAGKFRAIAITIPVILSSLWLFSPLSSLSEINYLNC
jgi:hypothetical protein